MSNKMVFIVGMARTGTTLMARSLSKGTDIYFLNETHFMREYQHLLVSEEPLTDFEFIHYVINQFITIQRKDYYRKSEYQEYPGAESKIIEMFEANRDRTFLDLLNCLFIYEASRKGKKRAGDQTPNHVFFIDRIFSFYPNSRFINMIRDPRAVVLSQKNKWKAAKRQKQPLFEVIRSRINYHPVTQSILWKRSVDAGLRAIKKWGEIKVKTIYYEHLVNEPELQLKAVCTYADIQFCPDMLGVSVSMSSNVSTTQVSGMDPSLIDKWRTKLSSTEIFIVDLICGSKASQFGYEQAKARPNIFMLMFYLFVFPVHIVLAYLLSAGRFKSFFHVFGKSFRNNPH